MRTIKLTQPDAWQQMPPTGTLRKWITDRGSLTARIVGNFDDFNLVRLGQQLVVPLIDERRALGLRRGELAMVREVVLRSGVTPLVFAHTAVNPRDLADAWRGLSRLGSRPLAEMLFHDPLVSRMPIEYRKLRQGHALLRRGGISSDTWARRSVFLKHGQPLMVTEVFLPSLGL
ncbi:MAG: chorismate lyase [Rhodocyclaceae bacterium]|jgi:chorismate--pyruvate lyase|nr:chorismate lyase [Rhodocyclaceae bacterium]MCA3026375.1 chorismate lyase [Rhodocyclaceae bacterium]MCA3032128.1 chorismate lyase [Rhodocyclaceae bacterium]MCA3038950.1 chorismate lyase [Rhodocyclaceae bacterium]MCA3048011.1 chorismate lyase [Rhodocyclaceae bacterium]